MNFQSSIIPGTVGHQIIERNFKNGFTETRVKYYQSPEWKNQKRPKMKRVL